MLVFMASAALFAGCRGAQSALDPAGTQANTLHDLWWLFFPVTGAVYLIVMAVLLTTIFRSRRKQKQADANTAPELAPDEAREARMGNVIKGAIAVTAIILFVFMISSFQAGREINRLYQDTNPLIVKVTGHQWWWEFEYQDDVPSRNVLTANELHIPVGRTIKFQLESPDVIHSFWVPNLHGKKDLVPGYRTTFVLKADEPGTYWGQCAEFCGHQHAKMRFVVVAEPEEDFNRWIAAQREPAISPATELQARGQEVFLTTTCIQCHTVHGTPANGRVGPNLTHVASRPYIAAGSVENNLDNVTRWMTDPHAFKPGVRMPMNTYSAEDLNALAEYIRSLK
jgi:cytochrome c oxidase subunit II